MVRLSCSALFQSFVLATRVLSCRACGRTSGGRLSARPCWRQQTRREDGARPGLASRRPRAKSRGRALPALPGSGPARSRSLYPGYRSLRATDCTRRLGHALTQHHRNAGACEVSALFCVEEGVHRTGFRHEFSISGFYSREGGWPLSAEFRLRALSDTFYFIGWALNFVVDWLDTRSAAGWCCRLESRLVRPG